MSSGSFTDDLHQYAEVCMAPRQSFIRRLQLGLGIVVAITVIGMTAILVSEQRVDAALDSSQTALRLLDDFKEVQIRFSGARAAEREFLLEDLRAPNFFHTGESAVLDSHAAAIGDLDKVARVVRLGGFINSAPGFTDGAKVMNGASDLMVEVFGDMGRHARATVGVAALPADAAVEVEGLFEIV